MPDIAAPLVRHRVFTDRPSQKDIERYVEEITSTATPEGIDDLHQGPIPPDEPFNKLAPITLKATKRDECDMAFCPRCGRHNQYLSGWLIYLPQMEAIACVGNECAAADVGRAADREYEDRQRRVANNNYLLETLPKLGAAIEHTQGLRAKCEAAEAVYRTLKKDGSDAWRALKNVVRLGGILSVNEVMQSSPVGPSGIRGSGGYVQTRSRQFGPLRGQTMLKNSFNPCAARASIERTFQQHLCPTDDDILALGSLSDDRMEMVCSLLRSAFAQLSGLESDLKDLASFFASSNLDAIMRWSAHPDSAFRGLKFSRRRFNGKEVVLFEYPQPKQFKQMDLPAALNVPD